MTIHTSKFPRLARCIEQMPMLRCERNFGDNPGRILCLAQFSRPKTCTARRRSARALRRRAAPCRTVPGAEAAASPAMTCSKRTPSTTLRPEIDGDGRWQHLSGTRTTEVGSSRADLDHAFDEIHRRSAEEARHKLSHRMIVAHKWGCRTARFFSLAHDDNAVGIVMASAWSCVA